MTNVVPQMRVTAAHISSNQNRCIRNRKTNRKTVSMMARPSTKVHATGTERLISLYQACQGYNENALINAAELIAIVQGR